MIRYSDVLVAPLLSCGAAAAAVLTPVPLLTLAAAGQPPTRRFLWSLAAAAAVAGIAADIGAAQWGPVALDPIGRLILALVVVVLVATAAIDARYFVIPDLYVLVLMVAAFVGPLAAPLRQGLIGAAVCGGLFLAIYLSWRFGVGIEGLGFGDVKLATALGALLGWRDGLLCIAAASTLGAAGVWVVSRRSPQAAADATPVKAPLGALLAGAGLIRLLWALA